MVGVTRLLSGSRSNVEHGASHHAGRIPVQAG